MSLVLKESSKYLQRSDCELITPIVVHSDLPETEEAESFTWDLENAEIHSCAPVVQVIGVVSTINLPPRFLGRII